MSGVDQIMRLADEWYAHGQMAHTGIGEKYAALRAAVEQLVRERDAANTALLQAQTMLRKWDIRFVLRDAARYWHLRDESNPDECRFFLATNESRATNFKDPAFIDKQVDTDRANMEARSIATKA